jgi:predicted transcriptional regulator
MNDVKREALELVDRLPDDCTWADVAYQVFVVAEVKKGLEEIEAGLGISHEEMKKEMEEWRSSYGRRMPEPISDTSMPTLPATP